METIAFLLGVCWLVVGLVGSQNMIAKGYGMSAHSYLSGAMLGPLQIGLAALLPDLTTNSLQQYPPLTQPISPNAPLAQQGTFVAGFCDFSMHCPSCARITAHEVQMVPVGFQLKFVLADKPLIGGKKYFLACSSCRNFNKELSKMQVNALREKS